MANYNIKRLKNKDFIVLGTNKKVILYKNSFSKQQITAGNLAIVATNDTKTVVASETKISNAINVLTNDTIGGTTATTSKVTLTKVSGDASLTLNNNGNVDVAEDTTAGTYNLTYKICQIDRPENCKTATVSITVTAE